MGFSEDRGWDRWRNEKHRPEPLPKWKRIRIELGLTTLAMAFFLALLVFF